MYIDPGIAAAIIAVVLTGGTTLVAFLFKQINDHAKWMAAANERELSSGDKMTDMAQRIRSLEEWRNGVDFGRTVERAYNQSSSPPKDH